jgi:hypothetical protein
MPDAPQRGVTITLHSLVKTVVVVVLLAGAGAIGYSLHGERSPGTKPSLSAEHRASSSSAVLQQPSSRALQSVAPTGIYMDGSPGTPQYFITFNAGSNGKVSGAVDFLYQDGQTEVAFTFVGTLSGSGSTATLTPVAVPQDQYGQLTTSVPPAISALLSSTTISLGECVTFLPFVTTMAGCTFTLSSSGL